MLVRSLWRVWVFFLRIYERCGKDATGKKCKLGSVSLNSWRAALHSGNEWQFASLVLSAEGVARVEQDLLQCLNLLKQFM